MQVTAVKWHPPVKMARDGLVEKDDKHDVAQVLSMIAESDESGSDMELSDLEIGGSESKMKRTQQLFHQSQVLVGGMSRH